MLARAPHRNSSLSSAACAVLIPRSSPVIWKHSLDCLSALVTDRAMEAWYHSLHCMNDPQPEGHMASTSHDENSWPCSAAQRPPGRSRRARSSRRCRRSECCKSDHPPLTTSLVSARASRTQNLHFDIRQYNCIGWTDEGKLALRLQRRIEALLGRGPK
jgi:hypothetical protein